MRNSNTCIKTLENNDVLLVISSKAKKIVNAQKFYFPFIRFKFVWIC